MIIITDCKMPRVEENSIASSLHYALTHSQCSVCGAQLEWKAEFNDIRLCRKHQINGKVS